MSANEVSNIGTWLTYGMSGGLFLFLNRGAYWKSSTTFCLTLVNVGLLALATVLSMLGTYAAIAVIVADDKGVAWTCADNSSS